MTWNYLKFRESWCCKSSEPVDRYSGSSSFSYSHDLIHPFGGDLITRNPRLQFPQPSRSPRFPPCGGARSVECWCWLLKRQRCQDVSWYCWWKKSCTTLHVWNPVNIGRNYLSTGAGFVPSTDMSCTLVNFVIACWNERICFGYDGCMTLPGSVCCFISFCRREQGTCLFTCLQHVWICV